MDTASDFEQRKTDFLKDYEGLVEKYQCDVASAPQYFPMGGGAFGTMLMKDIVDLKDRPLPPTPSPFQV